MNNLEISKKTIIGIVFAFVALLFLFCLPKIGEEAEAARLKVAAGLSPSEKAEWDITSR